MAKILQIPEHLTPDKTLTKDGYAADAKAVGDRFVDVAKYKYFNFIEAGVDVEGNPTYAEIKEAVENGYIPFLKYGKYVVAHMTISNCDPNDDQNQGQFTFVASNSRADMGWVMEVNEFWCCLQDDGSTLWRSGTHYMSEDFVAEYGVTSFAEIQNAYNSEKDVICTHGWLVAKLDIFAPDNYAQFSGIDDVGNPVLLKVTRDDVWTRTNAAKASEDYVNSAINNVNDNIAKQKTFVAEYGAAVYQELLTAYKAGKSIILRIPKGKITSTINKEETFLPLSYAEGSNDVRNFVFTTTNNEQILHCMVTTDNVWKYYVNDLNSRFASLEHGVDDIGKYIAGKNSLLSALGSMNTVDILKSVYNFRGGFRDNAGTLHITNPGVYLVMAGGTSNKTITINKPEGKAFEATNWSGVILMAYENGAITPIGIKSSLTFTGAFELPGTYQGWTSDGRYSTTITYPAKCVIAYLGNSNVNYLD